MQALVPAMAQERMEGEALLWKYMKMLHSALLFQDIEYQKVWIRMRERFEIPACFREWASLQAKAQRLSLYDTELFVSFSMNK